jgi:hypothetical protein
MNKMVAFGFGMLLVSSFLLTGEDWRDWAAWLLAYWAGCAMTAGRSTPAESGDKS